MSDSTPDSSPSDGPTPRAVIRQALNDDGRARRLAGASVGFTGHQVAEALVPVVIGAVIDRAVATSDAAAFGRWVLVIGVLFAGLTLSWRFAARAAAGVSEYGAHSLRMAITRRTLDPHGMSPRRMPGEVYSIATADASGVAYFTHTLSTKLAAALGVLTAAVSLLLISVPLGLLVLIATPPVLLLMQWLAKPLERRSEIDQDRSAHAGALATDMIGGLRVLSGLGATGQASTRYRTASRSALDATMSAQRAQSLYSAANTLVGSGFLALIAFVGARMAVAGSISVGQLIAVVGLAQFLQGPLVDVAYFGAGLARTRASATRVARLLGTGHAVRPATSPEPVTDTTTLTVDGLHTTHLENITFAVRRGEILGVVTGSGRHASDLVDCLARRVTPVAGTIRIGDTPIDRVPIDELRSAVFAPPHDAALFSGSVAANVGVAAVPGADLTPVVAAAAVDEIETALPAGLDTHVTEQGRSLSGGQRQRIALARALAADPPVLVLHDPTTAVDSVTESRIADGIRALRPDGATVLLTTSPVLLGICDRVIVLGPGAAGIVEGTHAQLLDAAGNPGAQAYRSMVTA
ncbi:ABC transporter ATP-binding protein [Rhodococcus sp. ABRD24]|uniref:ABC transporter ATP-binding protein n=1 Tax=Rhodococcus sp. ABRD24 TaxID=2507582 RepID=UPI001F61F85E|nr:ABC transporter ATP-binding protein [Rhodococcus sp. ABRD24]